MPSPLPDKGTWNRNAEPEPFSHKVHQKWSSAIHSARVFISRIQDRKYASFEKEVPRLQLHEDHSPRTRKRGVPLLRLRVRALEGRTGANRGSVN